MYWSFAVILINLVAFALAYLVTRGIKGQNFFRAGFFVPNLIGGIVLGYVWQFVFNRAFVSIASAISGGNVPSLLATEAGAMFCLILVSVWQYAGYMMLIYVAGFMSVPESLKEAALIDGCNPGQALRNSNLHQGVLWNLFHRHRSCNGSTASCNASYPDPVSVLTEVHRQRCYFRSSEGLNP